MNKWSAEQLKEALSKADVILRPLVIYVNPLDEQTLVEALGDMHEQVIIKRCEIIERGSALAIRKKIAYSFGGLCRQVIISGIIIQLP